jgi:hypothetical protein
VHLMSLSEAWPDKRDRATTNSPGNSRHLELDEVTADRHRADAEATGHVLYSKRPVRDQLLSERDEATLTVEVSERGSGRRVLRHFEPKSQLASVGMAAVSALRASKRSPAPDAVAHIGFGTQTWRCVIA